MGTRAEFRFAALPEERLLAQSQQRLLAQRARAAERSSVWAGAFAPPAGRASPGERWHPPTASGRRAPSDWVGVWGDHCAALPRDPLTERKP